MLVLHTDNAFTDIAEYDSFSPSWNTSGLVAGELLMFAPPGSPLDPKNIKPTVTGEIKPVPNGPFFEFSSGNNDGYIDTKVVSPPELTVMILIDPNNNLTQRLFFSSYAGGADAGVSIAYDAATSLFGVFTGYKNAAGTPATQWISLAGVSKNKPVLLVGKWSAANNSTTFISMTDGLRVGAGMTAGNTHYRGTKTNLVGRGVSGWGPATKSKIGGYLMFDRIVPDEELEMIRDWMLKNIRSVYPDTTF